MYSTSQTRTADAKKDIMRLMKVDLSEPYSIYTYRYFIHKWPHLCFLVGVALSNLILSLSHLFLLFAYRQSVMVSV